MRHLFYRESLEQARLVVKCQITANFLNDFLLTQTRSRLLQLD